MRYSADITAGSLKVAESRIIALELITDASGARLREMLVSENLLNARSPETALRLGRLIIQRLRPWDADFWRFISEGDRFTATHACLAAAVKHSRLLGDFMDTTLREHYATFGKELSPSVWPSFLEACAARDPDMPKWNPSTIQRLRSTVFQILAQAGYLDNTRNCQLQKVRISPDVMRHLSAKDESYVIRCLEVGQ